LVVFAPLPFFQSPVLPVVRFTNGQEHTIKPETWNLKVQGHTTASIEQIPLDLSWAISIHRSQGLVFSFFLLLLILLLPFP
jgi:ATP-dependent exoDNAse (exonuclease V) alpha subunit